MRKEHIDLRKLAALGNTDAALQLGLTYLHGAHGIAANHHAALYYLAPHLHLASVCTAVAEAADLAFLWEAGLFDALQRASRESQVAARKLAALRCLTSEEGHAHEPHDVQASQTAQCVEVLRAAVDGSDVRNLEALAARVAAAASPRHRRRILGLCLQVAEKPRELDGMLLHSLRYAAETDGELSPLTPELIRASLARSADGGDTYAQYLLGSAQLGLRDTRLEPRCLIPKQNFREGYARLLRAALGGEPNAWLALFHACSDQRSLLANQGAAQLFLECAADAGLAPAQTARGARVLLGAENAGQLACGQHWLLKAKAGGGELATALLMSFDKGSPRSIHSEAARILAGLDFINNELSLVLRIACIFGLTRDEAVALDLANCHCASSLILDAGRPRGGFSLPAITADAEAVLRQVDEYRPTAASWGAGFQRRRSATLRAFFATHNVQERIFFEPDPSPARSILGWRKGVDDLLRTAAACKPAD